MLPVSISSLHFAPLAHALLPFPFGIYMHLYNLPHPTLLSYTLFLSLSLKIKVGAICVGALGIVCIHTHIWQI